jgi:hypothetical protein
MHSIRHHPASVGTQIRQFGRGATGHRSEQDAAHSGGSGMPCSWWARGGRSRPVVVAVGRGGPGRGLRVRLGWSTSHNAARLVSGAAVERLVGGPADVAGADAGLAEDLRRAPPGPSRSSARAAAEPRREHGVRAGTLQQHGPGDRPGPGPGEQDVLRAGRGEPASPAGEGSRLERAHGGQVAGGRLGNRDTGPDGAPGSARRRAAAGQVGHQVQGVMGVPPAARGEESHRGGQVARHSRPDVRGASAARRHAAGTARAHLPQGRRSRAADSRAGPGSAGCSRPGRRPRTPPGGARPARPGPRRAARCRPAAPARTAASPPATAAPPTPGPSRPRKAGSASSHRSSSPPAPVRHTIPGSDAARGPPGRSGCHAMPPGGDPAPCTERDRTTGTTLRPIADSVLENDQAQGVVYGAHISHSCAPV